MMSTLRQRVRVWQIWNVMDVQFFFDKEKLSKTLFYWKEIFLMNMVPDNEAIL